ncbi:MAG: sugar phosphate isomerase/epimerase [Verrucomicrobia bacterium]|nr:sugar phosphate isomerase/epimerase [Verrucomicrobiota bacterium]
MLRCISTLGCPDFSLDETLALAARHGLAAVEIRALGGTVELPRYFAGQFGAPEALAAQMRGATVRVAALDTSLKLAGAAPGDREAFLAYVPWAEALGARWLRVFDGGKAGDAAELIAMAETVRWWRDVRRANGWAADIFIETHDSLFTADAINRFRSHAPGTAILWDSHHTWKKGGEDPVATWRAIRDGVVHVHVKDSISVPSAKHPFTYVLPGDGEFPIAPLLAALRADGFGGLVSLEWERLWHPYLPSLDEALTVARARAWW